MGSVGGGAEAARAPRRGDAGHGRLRGRVPQARSAAPRAPPHDRGRLREGIEARERSSRPSLGAEPGRSRPARRTRRRGATRMRLCSAGSGPRARRAKCSPSPGAPGCRSPGPSPTRRGMRRGMRRSRWCTGRRRSKSLSSIVPAESPSARMPERLLVLGGIPRGCRARPPARLRARCGVERRADGVRAGARDLAPCNEPFNPNQIFVRTRKMPGPCEPYLS